MFWIVHSENFWLQNNHLLTKASLGRYKKAAMFCCLVTSSSLFKFGASIHLQSPKCGRRNAVIMDVEIVSFLYFSFAFRHLRLSFSVIMKRTVCHVIRFRSLIQWRILEWQKMFGFLGGVLCFLWGFMVLFCFLFCFLWGVKWWRVLHKLSSVCFPPWKSTIYRGLQAPTRNRVLDMIVNKWFVSNPKCWTELVQKVSIHHLIPTCHFQSLFV